MLLWKTIHRENMIFPTIFTSIANIQIRRHFLSISYMIFTTRWNCWSIVFITLSKINANCDATICKYCRYMLTLVDYDNEFLLSREILQYVAWNLLILAVDCPYQQCYQIENTLLDISKYKPNPSNYLCCLFFSFDLSNQTNSWEWHEKDVDDITKRLLLFTAVHSTCM